MPFSGERIREVKPFSFIYEVLRALPADVCLEAIRRFEAGTDQQYRGRIGPAGDEAPEVKRSTDLRIRSREDWRDIDRALSQQLVATFNAFALEFSFFAANSFKDTGYNLQRTLPGEYLPLARGRRSGSIRPRAATGRDLVPQRRPGAGRRESEFPLQEIVIRPVQGKMIVFPPFWTHVHRGKTLESGVKYIATTWICFA